MTKHEKMSDVFVVVLIAESRKIKVLGWIKVVTVQPVLQARIANVHKTLCMNNFCRAYLNFFWENSFRTLLIVYEVFFSINYYFYLWTVLFEIIWLKQVCIKNCKESVHTKILI